MLPVVASLVALVAGPLLLALAGRSKAVLSFVDGLVLVTIGGLVTLHVLPHALLVTGPSAIAAAVLGLAAPLAVEWVSERGALSQRALLPIALVGIGLHALLDGAVLGGSDHDHGAEHGHADEGTMLVAGVVLHRLSEGTAIFWLARAKAGLKGAAGALGLVCLATVAGALMGERIGEASGHALHLVQAFVAGSLLHVMVHHDPQAAGGEGVPAPDHDGLQVASTLGALAGGALLFAASHVHPVAQRVADEMGMGATFLTLALESAPTLLAAYVAVGLLQAAGAEGPIAWLSRGPRPVQALRALLVGPILPVCSCGVLPLYQGFLARGAPLVSALTMLIAAPEVGVASVLLSGTLLGPRFTAVRVASALLTALVVGLVVGSLFEKRSGNGDPQAARNLGKQDGSALLRFATGTQDVVEHTAPWIIVGLGLASLAEPLVKPDGLARLAGGHDVPMLALLGVPLYVCASGATPLVAVLLHKGLSAGAAVAFLLTGPATNLTTFGILAKMHGKRVALFFAALVLLLAIGAGYATNSLLGEAALPSLHDAALEGPSLLESVSLFALSLLFVGALLRRGPRYLVAQVMSLELGVHRHEATGYVSAAGGGHHHHHP